MTLECLAKQAFAGQPLELETLSEIGAWNQFITEMGQPERVKDVGVIALQGQAVRDLRFYDILKSGLTHAQLGATLPGGQLPPRQVLLWHTLETLKHGHN